AESLPSREERLRERPDAPPPFKFWDNLDERPLDWIENWLEREPDVAQYRGWMRFRPTSTFDDVFLEAARSLLLLDTMGWPAAVRGHAEPLGYIAPNIDVNASFHRFDPTSKWLFIEATEPVGADGL